MSKTLIGIIFSTIMIISGCTSSSSQGEYNDESSYVPETLEDTTQPTIHTEIPTSTNNEIVTQADSSS